MFFKCASEDSTCTRVVDYTPNAAIHGGYNVENTLEVQAIGSHFEFFVNGTQVGQADDTWFQVGEVGLTGDQDIEVVFTNITILLPSPTAATPTSSTPASATPTT